MSATHDKFDPATANNGLAAGASSEPRTAPWAATVGSHTLQACADITNTIIESNEENNCATTAFTVRP